MPLCLFNLALLQSFRQADDIQFRLVEALLELLIGPT